MGDPQRHPQDLIPDHTESPAADRELPSSLSKFKGSYQWWTQMILYSIFLLAGQTAGTLLGRIYFTNGGNSQWLATLLLLVGFPILVPFRWLKTRSPNRNQDANRRPEIETRQDDHRKFPPILAGIYIVLGVLSAANCLLYSIGLQYLSVTTYMLICTSQLGFNALFSYILNGQKFTPYIVNSLVLLTLSSVLLVLQPETASSSPNSSNNNKKHVIGFICTLGASAGYALTLSITQLAFQRIIKQETVATVVDMAVYQSLVASAIVVVGVFASGDWRRLHGEMTGYRQGPVAYVMNLVWTAVSWQVFSVGCIGLIFRVSSLFSNVISVLGTPLAPAMAVVFLGEKMTGLKGVAMVVATWGLASYMYQCYLDDLEKTRMEKEGQIGIAMAAPV